MTYWQASHASKIRPVYTYKIYQLSRFISFCWGLWESIEETKRSCLAQVGFHGHVMFIEERFFVSSREFCPAHRRGHWRFAVWAHGVSVFARACSVLLFTCLHTYTTYKWIAWAMFYMVITETTRCRCTNFVPRTLMKLYQFWEKVLVLHLFPGVWGF